MFDAEPQVTPAVCEMRVGLDEARVRCAFVVQAEDGIAVVAFVTEGGGIALAGRLNSNGLEVVRVFDVETEQSAEVIGACGHNPQTRIMACFWYGSESTEYSIIARY